MHSFLKHGWLAIDKPLGITSTTVTAKVKRLLKPTKIGHGGTLDPLATGVLPIAIGEATKTVSYVMAASKVYEFEVTWGEERTTDDKEGEVVAVSAMRPSEKEIKAVLKNFIGGYEQIPPQFSALKVAGKRAYELKRAGHPVELKPRFVKIERLTLLACTEKTASFEVKCGQGTYVRSLARDIAHHLKTYGYVSVLRRTAVGFFNQSNIISLEKLAKAVENPVDKKEPSFFFKIPAVLDDILAAEIGEEQEKKLRQGQALSSSLFASLYKEEELVLCLGSHNIPVALTKVKNGQLWPIRVFNIERKEDVDYC